MQIISEIDGMCRLFNCASLSSFFFGRMYAMCVGLNGAPLSSFSFFLLEVFTLYLEVSK